MNQLDATMRGVREFERLITMGRNDGSQPNFPAFDLPSTPPMVTAGIFERLEKIVRRIRVAPGYDPAIGSLLAIIPTNGRDRAPEDLSPPSRFGPTPTRMLFCPVSEGYVFSLSTHIQRDGSEQWENGAFLTSSPSRVKITPTTPGVPERIWVRVRMLKGNEPVTPFSIFVSVTVNP